MATAHLLYRPSRHIEEDYKIDQAERTIRDDKCNLFRKDVQIGFCAIWQVALNGDDADADGGVGFDDG